MKTLKNVDILVLAGFMSNLFYSLCYPVIHIYLIKGISSNIISLCSLSGCVLTALISKIWIKHSNNLYKHLPKLLLLESIVYSVIIIQIILGIITPKMYYILDTFLFAIITNNIICGGNRLKALRYNDKDRENYDNKTQYWCNIASIIGFAFGSIITIKVTTGFTIMFIATSIDNIFYYIAYKNTNKKYK